VNRDFLIALIEDVTNAKKQFRDDCALKIIDSPELFPYLLYETFNTTNKLHIKCAWILEWICTHYGLELLLPHLDYYTSNLNKLTENGAIRTCAKICEHLGVQFNRKTPNQVQMHITEKHIDSIIEVGFDWMITNQKIAIKAYTMRSLYEFGLHRDWVHDELKHIISSTVIHESKGIKARSKLILNLITKNKKSNI